MDKASEIETSTSSLSRTLLHGSEGEDYCGLFCQPCDCENLRIPAHGFCQDCQEHLCETCYKTHRRPAPCRNHVLLDFSQMPKEQVVSALKTGDTAETCRRHKGKTVEYLCRDHDVLGCCPCVTMDHRCCKIDFIPDVSKDYSSSEDYQIMMAALQRLQEKAMLETKFAIERKEALKENIEVVKHNIKMFRRFIDDMLDTWESNINKEADSIYSTEKQSLEKAETEFKQLSSEISGLRDSYISLEKADKNMALFIKKQKDKCKVEKLEERFSEVKSNLPQKLKYQFIQNESVTGQIFGSIGNEPK